MDVQQWIAECPESFPDRADLKTPNHNPLIGYSSLDTLNNVHDAMLTLQELTANCEQEQLTLSEHATTGLFMLMECTIHALHFELYHRK